MNRYSLSAIGVDRPGIVAGIARVLKDQGCNLEDSTMSILQGHFAVMLVVHGPEVSSADDLRLALDPVIRAFDLLVAIRALDEGGVELREAQSDASPGLPSEPWAITVHGADQPGIVLGVAQAIADAGGNIVDLSTNLVGSGADGIYVMAIETELPGGASGDGSEAAQAIKRAAAEVGVSCVARPATADLL